jgi:glycosyltransferase involved in cell wall biosynthesis
VTAIAPLAGHERTKARTRALSVLVVTNMYPTPESPHYGTFVAEQVDALRERDDIERVDVLFVDGREKPLNYLRGISDLRRMMAGQSYDLIHAHYGLAGAIAVSQRRVPVVITFHSGDIDYIWWHKHISRGAAALSKINLCVCVKDMPKLMAPSFHLPCGIEIDRFRPRNRQAARAIHGISEEQLAILFPGPRTHKKKAYDRFEDVRDELRKRGHDVVELRLENTVREEVPTLFAAADVLVMTSRSEGSPVSVMEALSGGVPIVATNVGDVRPMVEGAPGCYVGEYDVERFADEIERVRDSGERTPRVRARRFSQERIVSALRDVYAEAVGR